MRYVMGVDLGTSAVKVLLMNEEGVVVDEATKSYPLLHEKPGYSEQNPADWVNGTTTAIAEIIRRFDGDVASIVGLSYSGQMHGLVLLGAEQQVIRPAILWNDTRTTAQCATIVEVLGQQTLLQITKNHALEGFTLPKLLWVKEHEPENYRAAKTMLLPKDYVRYAMTGALHMDFSDAAGTLLLDVEKNDWSYDIADAFGIEPSLLPPLVSSTTEVGQITEDFAAATGLSVSTKVYAGGADNACGAVGAGIVTTGKTMVSIGTSGVLLSYEQSGEKNFDGQVHYFNHAVAEAYYTMGVTLSAGHSLSWFKENFVADASYDELLENIATVEAGSNGLLFTPYLVGERTPYADAHIRASFIGVDTAHKKYHFARAVMEGIVFSLRDSLEIFRASGKAITEMISIGGGAKNPLWLQMQADIFNTTVYKLKNEQGPSIGACMIAAVGAKMYPDFSQAVEVCVQLDEKFEPNMENVKRYDGLYKIYKQVYAQTKQLNDQLAAFR
ncbi:MAG: xylulokinase [Solibacillus sp.]